ncbi:hydantoinase/oxoprolinase family protein [Bordetella sp. BOR01]|uniref:hydantoinase/oxoprolinase family protein n=1 Tax=Bordetella sp. BOR01 TaxID=2854779 RepID=UPI001C4596EB|nr:hydantoinase/oxoprolinase family protein [Bordetella sp. BOR01]MBV7483172.1 hydantoinase/oxoprolinase family protein [Bordetella sp. BOR01]
MSEGAGRSIAVAVDTGGTHTDIVLSRHGEIHTLKVPTTPADLSVGILRGVRKICEKGGISFGDVDRFFYASTFATNIIVEGRGSRVALITTKGFRDVLEIGRASRKPDVYDLNWRPPTPLVPRELRFEVQERIDHTGKVLTVLDEAKVRAVLERIRDLEVRHVAVCLLHAYANPEHEERIAAIAREIAPELSVSLASRVVPEFREYERASTTCVSALIAEPICSHLDTLSAALDASGLDGQKYIMRANGGLSTFERAADQPAAVTHSGVMGGIVAAASLAAHCGIANVISFDMGGTSTDVALIQNGQPSLTNRSTVGGHPVLIPTLEMVTIGAGGGSLAWLEQGHALRVGPRSAGSEPGPACYDQGGDQPTVTDANLFCGRLNGQYFLDGARALRESLSERAIQEKIADPLGLTAEAAALGMIAIAESHMVNAIRLISIERGMDPRDFTLVAFGGAGALHAVNMADQLNIGSVLIPPAPGNLSAMGSLFADVRHDLSRTLLGPLNADRVPEVKACVAQLIASAGAALRADGVPDEKAVFGVSADIRYKGQNHEINVPLTDTDLESDFSDLARRFHALHERIYGYCFDNRQVQIVNVRVCATGSLGGLALHKRPAARSPLPEPAQMRPVVIERSSRQVVPVYRYVELEPGHCVMGPAIVEYPDSTLFLPGKWQAKMDVYGNLLARRAAGTDATAQAAEQKEAHHVQ